MAFDLNTTLVSVRAVPFFLVRLSIRFKYNSCVGSSAGSVGGAPLSVYLNTTLVSVRVHFVKSNAPEFLDLNTTLVSVREWHCKIGDFPFRLTDLNTTLVSVRVPK